MSFKESPWKTGFAIMVGLGVIFFIGVFLMTRNAERLASQGERIGLIRVEGIILDSKNVIDELKRYSKNPSVKVILLRIDSPGGAVVPAQEIYEEIQTLKRETEKKVVTSMGSIAASGGYYIASASDIIVANPGTLTGSIGVIMEMANVEGLLKKVGVQSVVIKSGKRKDVGSPFRTMRPEERELLQSVLDDVHSQFIEAVAEGRGMTEEEVRPLADGRIFTGRQAKGLGLVDELGTLQYAIALAAGLVGIEGDPVILEKEKKFSLVDFLRSQWNGSLGSLGSLGSMGLSRGTIRLDYLVHLGS